jgi:hypothetical protein
MTESTSRTDSTGATEAAGTSEELRPGQLCAELLLALDASEGRRKRRARDTTPDAIGMRIKRELLEEIALADPAPAEFEAWLVQRCLQAGVADGPVRAMALSIWDEWRLAATTREFRRWLAHGAPSDDRENGDGPSREPRSMS